MTVSLIWIFYFSRFSLTLHQQGKGALSHCWHMGQSICFWLNRYWYTLLARKKVTLSVLSMWLMVETWRSKASLSVGSYGSSLLIVFKSKATQMVSSNIMCMCMCVCGGRILLPLGRKTFPVPMWNCLVPHQWSISHYRQSPTQLLWTWMGVGHVFLFFCGGVGWSYYLKVFCLLLLPFF